MRIDQDTIDGAESALMDVLDRTTLLRHDTGGDNLTAEHIREFENMIADR